MKRLTSHARVGIGLLLLSVASQVAAQSQPSSAPGASRTYTAPVAPPNRPAASSAPTSSAASGATASSATATAPAAKPTPELPDIIYIQPLLGGGYVLLKALDSDNFNIDDPMATNPDELVVTTKGSGLRYGVAAGLNIVFIHLGGRVAFTQTSAFTLGTAQLEVALVPQLGPIEPSVRLGLGYAWQGGAKYGTSYKGTSIDGLSIGAGIGLDVRLGQVVGIGVGLDADLLNMSRETDITRPGHITVDEGSALGVQVAFTGHLTLHI